VLLVESGAKKRVEAIAESLGATVIPARVESSGVRVRLMTQ
jgi:hypothetical protein